MIVTQNNRSISRSGDIRDTSFSVKATGKAFKILSSSLYKNKIQAIVRELSTNAADAHALAGTPLKPFEVHLPNALEPYFMVRDFGPGLGEDDVYTVYTTYFESTKTESNDFTGALGLGSKSPFSYTDTYTVISRHQRFKNVYTLYMNEDDCPVVSRLGPSVPCGDDEPDGLEVKMSVKNHDMSSFINEAKAIYSRFSVAPVVKGCSHFQVAQRSYTHDGGFYKIVESKNLSSYNDPQHVLVMGNIAYPIEMASFVDRASPGSLLRKHYQNLRAIALEVHAPIGSVDFTAGREDLSYDQRVTIPYLLNAYERLLTDFIGSLSKRYKNVKSEFEARLLYANSCYDPIFRFASDSIVWNNRQINSYSMHLCNIPDGIEVRRSQNLISTIVGEAKDLNGKPNPHGRNVSIEITSDLVFYVNDLKRNGVKVLRSYFHNHSSVSKYHSYYVVAEGKTAKEDLEKFMKNFEGAEVVPLSTIPVPAAKQAPTRKPTKVKRLTDRAKNSGTISGLPEVEVDLDDGGIYVLSEFSSLRTDKSRMRNYCSLQTYIGQMVDLVGKDNPVYVVPISISSRIEKHPAWIRLEDVARQQLEKKLKSFDLDSLYVANSTNTGSSKYEGMLDFYKAHRSELDPAKSSICAFAQMFDKIVELKQHAQTLLPLANAFDLVSNPRAASSSKGKDIQLENSFKTIADHYPMLDLIDSSRIKDRRVLHYVQQCDKQR